jgi:protein PsiE
MSETAEPDRPVPASDKADKPAERLFVWIERLLLLIITVMTLGAVGAEVASVIDRGTIELADLLLMFLYTEVIGMVAVYYTDKGSFFAFPIFIAITAIARLIVLQAKDMAPENVLFDAGAILLLAVAAIVILRFKSS